MKKVRNIFGVECKKVILKGTFPAMALVVVLMCLFIPISRDDGSMTNCLEVIFMMSYEEFVMSDSLRLASVMGYIISGYFTMFAPMIVSLAILPILCGENESGMVRYILPRCGKKESVMGAFLASIFSGGLVIVIGYLLFFINTATHSYFVMGIDGILMGEQEIQQMIINIIGVWGYGMICAVWTYLVSIFLRNRYLLACIPYIFLYLLDRMINSISYETLEDNLLKRWFVQSFGVGYLFIDFRYMFRIAMVYVVMSILIILLHLFVLQRRTDCGQ